jgi:hypothetical protein
VTAPGATSCVGRRVDWLTVAFRVRLDAEVLAAFVTTPKEKPPSGSGFHARAALARKYRIASCTLRLPPTSRERGGQDSGEWETRDFAIRMSGDTRTLLQNRDMRVVILESAPKSPDDDPNDPGWTVAVDISGTSLLGMGWRRAVREAAAVAGALGEVLEARLRRLDLCADMADFPIHGAGVENAGWCNRPQLRARELRRSKREHLPKRVRAQAVADGKRLLARFGKNEIKWDEMCDEFPDIDDTYYYPPGNITGWKFGKGKILARVYDKHAEMRKKIGEATSEEKRRQAGEKKAREERWWIANGWNGKGRIVRVECQLMGPVLHELDARCDSPSGALDVGAFVESVRLQLDRVWRYFAGLPDQQRRPLPELDDRGKCSKCGVRHKAPEDCPYTLPLRSGWLRQIVMETDAKGKPRRRSVCAPTPAWEAVQRVTFERDVRELPTRERKRSGVRVTQAIGTVNSALGHSQTLRAPRLPVDVQVVDEETGEVTDLQAGAEITHSEDAIAAALRARWPGHKPRSEAEPGSPPCMCGLCAYGYEFMDAKMRQAAREFAETLLFIYDDEPEKAIAMMWTRTNAAIARWKDHVPPPRTAGGGGKDPDDDPEPE